MGIHKASTVSQIPESGVASSLKFQRILLRTQLVEQFLGTDSWTCCGDSYRTKTGKPIAGQRLPRIAMEPPCFDPSMGGFPSHMVSYSHLGHLGYAYDAKQKNTT